MMLPKSYIKQGFELALNNLYLVLELVSSYYSMSLSVRVAHYIFSPFLIVSLLPGHSKHKIFVTLLMLGYVRKN